MRAELINHPNHIEVQFNQAVEELKQMHESSGGAFPDIYKDIDSIDAYYTKANIERWNMSIDGAYIEVHFVGGHKIQMSKYVFENHKNAPDNISLLQEINTYLL